MTFDWDDAYDGHDAIVRLRWLREHVSGDFRCTLFAIPGLCTERWCQEVPGWIELAVHGWTHCDNYECSRWTRADMERLLDRPIVQKFFARGFKAPGWQISDACYEVLHERGYWVADQHLEDGRRPAGMQVYFYEDGNWHGHIDNVCGNGIAETWDEVVKLVGRSTEFRWCGEAARVYPYSYDPRPGEAAARVSGVGAGADNRGVGTPEVAR